MSDHDFEMNDSRAVALIEGIEGQLASEEEVLEAWQHLINNGLVWNLQGFYGRTAINLIRSGICYDPRTVN